MPKPTYRIYGKFDWQSMSGNAIIALLNKPGSGKKINIHSIEVYPFSSGTTYISTVAIARVTNVLGGEKIPFIKLDTSSSDLPSQVEVRAGTTFTVSSYIYRRGSQRTIGTSSSVTYFVRYEQGVLGYGAWATSSPGGTLLPQWKTNVQEPIRIRPGEAVAVVPYNFLAPITLKVSVTLQAGTSTYMTNSMVQLVSASQSLVTVINGENSGTIIDLRGIVVGELGTYDTPYLRVVPIGSINPEALTDPTREVSYQKLDTNSQDIPSNVLGIYKDVPIIPKDVPAVYTVELTSALPRGFNYLHTKDYIGPTYMSFFPEVPTYDIGLRDLGLMCRGMRTASIKGGAFPISIREGEGLGIVSSAETAAGTTYGAGTAAYFAMDFGIIFTIEDTCLITVRVLDESNNPIEGARVYVARASDNYTIMNELTDANGIASKLYSYSGDVYVTIRVRKSTPPENRYLPVETVGFVKSVGMESTIVMHKDDTAES